MTGQPVTLSVQCSHTGEVVKIHEHQGQMVTSEWTTAHLHQVIEETTGVHGTCQRLMFAGQQMDEGCTIQQTCGCQAGELHQSFPSAIKISLLVDKVRFPMKLGPFSLVRVAVEDEDFLLPNTSEECRRDGFYWEMSATALQRHGLTSKAPRITGQVSPMFKVLLDFSQREALEVPQDAVDFAWSYPVSHYDALESDAYALDHWEEAFHGGAAAVKDFISVGGFMYFRGDGTIASAQTLGKPEEQEEGCLTFADPRRWDPEWTATLVAEGRFQRVTISTFVAYGARLCLWLRPCEVILGADGSPLPRQPQVPFGGFVYLFHADPLSMEPEDLALDRYFPVALDVEASKAHAKPVGSLASPRRGLLRSFTLVSNVDSAAAQRRDGAEEDTDADGIHIGKIGADREVCGCIVS